MFSEADNEGNGALEGVTNDDLQDWNLGIAGDEVVSVVIFPFMLSKW